MDNFSKIYHNLKKLLDDLIEHCTYSYQPNDQNQSSNIWRTIGLQSGLLHMTHSAIPHYYKFVQMLRELFPIITDSQHQRNTMTLLIRILRDSHGNSERIIKDWLNELFKLRMQHYTCAGLVAGYPFKHSLKINSVTIAPIESDEGNSIIEKECQEFKNFISKEFNGGINAVFSCVVEAYDNDSCILTSIRNVNRTLSFVKLLDRQSEIRLQVKDYTPTQESYCTHAADGIKYQSNNMFRHDFINLRCNFGEIKKLVDLAEKFFFKIDPTDLEKSILSALYWYGRIDTTFDDKITQYISYINGLERLVLFDVHKDKAVKFGERLSKIFKTSNDTMKKFYYTRNDLMHEYEPDIYKEDLVMLRHMLSTLIIDLIHQSESHQNLYSYFRQYHD